MIIETARLRLQPFTAGDGDDLFRLYGDARVMAIRKIGVQTRAGSEARLAEILEHWTRRGFGLMAVRERESGRFLGECGLREMAAEASPIELSYGLIPEVWGRGLASEASRAVLDWGFGDLGLDAIHAVARADNHRSRRVMEKLGFRLLAERVGTVAAVVEYRLARGDRRSVAVTAEGL